MRVPIAKPFIDEKEKQAVASVLESGWLVQGPRVTEFEEKIADFTGAKYAKATSSCTTALHVSLLASGINSGDEVLVSAFTYVASANAIEYAGATPIFIDIDQNTFNISPEQVTEYLQNSSSSKTRAIMPVHLFGLAADMDPLTEIAREYDLLIIEIAFMTSGE